MDGPGKVLTGHLLNLSSKMNTQKSLPFLPLLCALAGFAGGMFAENWRVRFREVSAANAISVPDVGPVEPPAGEEVSWRKEKVMITPSVGPLNRLRFSSGKWRIKDGILEAFDSFYDDQPREALQLVAPHAQLRVVGPPFLVEQIGEPEEETATVPDPNSPAEKERRAEEEKFLKHKPER